MIPELPELQTNEIILNALGEPSLQSLGLGCWYTPVGWVQQLLEFVHVNFNCPWYLTIIYYTIAIRTLMIPISILNQRSTNKMKIIGPELQECQANYSDAKKKRDIRLCMFFYLLIAVNLSDKRNLFY